MQILGNGTEASGEIQKQVLYSTAMGLDSDGYSTAMGLQELVGNRFIQLAVYG